MAVLISMHSVAIRAQNVAFGYLILKTMKRDFRVLTYVKEFFAPNMIKIQRSRMCIIAALNAATFHLYCVNYISSGLLKCARSKGFAGGVASAFYATVCLP